MNDRHREIIKIALLFMNIDLSRGRGEFQGMFGKRVPPVPGAPTPWEVGGEEVAPVTEAEVQDVLKEFQDIL